MTSQAHQMAAREEGDDRIELAWKPLNAAAVEQFCKAIRAADPGVIRIRVVDLTDNNLGPDNTSKIAAAVEASVVEELILRYNQVGKVGCDAVASALNVSSHLKLVDLRGNRLTGDEMRKLLKSVSMSTTVTQLGFGGNDLGPDGVALVASHLDRNISVTHLDLFSNNLGVEGAKHVGEFLDSTRCNLRTIDLWGNKLQAPGAERIVDSMRRNSTLTRLSMGNNAIGPSQQFGEALSQALAKNTALLHLDLRSNGLDSQTIRCFAPGLGQNATLKSLSLCSNPLGPQGADQLVKVLMSHPSLTSLDLWNCGLQSAGAIKLATLITNNGLLSEIILAENGIDDDGADALAKAIPLSKSLSVLDLVGNRIEQMGALQLMEAIQLNPRITALSLHGNSISRITQKKIDVVLTERKPEYSRRMILSSMPSRRPATLPFE